MGISDAFIPNLADFSGMDGQVNWLYVSAVLHNAVIEVNEEGCGCDRRRNNCQKPTPKTGHFPGRSPIYILDPR